MSTTTPPDEPAEGQNEGAEHTDDLANDDLEDLEPDIVTGENDDTVPTIITGEQP